MNLKPMFSTRWECSNETTCNSVKVKLGIKVMKLAESLIGWGVTVTGQGQGQNELMIVIVTLTAVYHVGNSCIPGTFRRDQVKRKHVKLVLHLRLVHNLTSNPLPKIIRLL